MKECWQEGELRAYLDRELPPEDMERVARHLDVCSECGDLWAELAGRAARVSAFLEELAVPRRTVSTARAPKRAAAAKWIWVGATAALAAGLVLGLVSMPKRPAPVAAVAPPVPVVRATQDPIDPPPPRTVSTVPHRPRVRAAQLVNQRSLPEIRSSDDFVSLDDEPISTGVVLRVELGPKGIPADVIFGPDGRPHAIRLVDNQSKH